MSRGRKMCCGKCGYWLRPELVHDAQFPGHSDGKYQQVRWVCMRCRRTQAHELEQSP
jgi:hypothetical protein